MASPEPRPKAVWRFKSGGQPGLVPLASPAAPAMIAPPSRASPRPSSRLSSASSLTSPHGSPTLPMQCAPTY